MADIKLRNSSKYEFVDISSEKYRVYVFGNCGIEVRIENPQWLAVSASGHRVLDKQEKSYFIPYGWISLQWEVGEDVPHFVK